MSHAIIRVSSSINEKYQRTKIPIRPGHKKFSMIVGNSVNSLIFWKTLKNELFLEKANFYRENSQK